MGKPPRYNPRSILYIFDLHFDPSAIKAGGCSDHRLAVGRFANWAGVQNFSSH